MTASFSSDRTSGDEVFAVRKPWGYEYPILETNDLGLWALFIAGGQSTSLHCHPKKKTGLAVITGNVKVSFLNDSMEIGPAGRLMIRPGLFHSSTATDETGAILLEIETPRDKEDLVRLEDQYGRKGLPYENEEHVFLLPDETKVFRKFQDLRTKSVLINGVEVRLKTYSKLDQLDSVSSKASAIVVGGFLVANPDQQVLSPGDIVSIATIKRLWTSFNVSCALELLTLERVDVLSSKQ